MIELSYPAINYTGVDTATREGFQQANKRFLELETYLGEQDFEIADRSISNVKLVLASITSAELADDAVTAAKIDVSKLSDIASNIGSVTSGTLTGVTIDKATITTPTMTGGTWSGGVITTGDFTGKAIIITAGSEVGPFNVTSGKLYSATIEHGPSQSYYGTGSDIAILHSTDSTYRLGIGNATIGSAPFRVTKAGVMTAVGATLTTPAITGGTIGSGTAITGASISNSSVDATVLTVAGSSKINVGAGTEIDFAGDTQFYRESTGNLRTDGNLKADVYIIGTTGGTFGPGSGSGRTDVNASGVQLYNTSLSNTVALGQAGTGYFSSSVRADGGFTTDATNYWQFGSKSAATVALDTANYVNVTIGGVGYKLGLVT